MKDKEAYIYSLSSPDEEQEKRIQEFLEKKYGEVKLSFIETPAIKNGFILRIGSDFYDWTKNGRLKSLERAMGKVDLRSRDFVRDAIEIIKDQDLTPRAVEIGRVISVGDNVARVRGLENAGYGEILLFDEGILGMVQNISQDELGCILFGDDEQIQGGSLVYRTRRTASVPVGENFLGRVVDALANPIDGGGEIVENDYYKIENKAPEILERKSVKKPLETGILAIDSMFPIGRGQRELIIGDRQTGKTSIAVDTIINQKGKDVICIYVSIGQKSSSTAHLVKTLKNFGAMDYTIVFHSSAADNAAMQYIAPYSACSMAEYFMNKGKDVLIVYDDLSKHAVAYRTISLLLGRSPGREAYPGDVFYLHSRLLERAACLSDARGGGSMTALPIVETQDGDVSAYIPTNIISITDGQIFLETDLFNSGQRPAVNIGLSVSRVGGDAQTKAMKKAVGSLRIDLSQYREMEVFTEFASDLDDSVKKELKYGSGLIEMLRQGEHKSFKLNEEVIILIGALNGSFESLELNDIHSFIDYMISYFYDEEAALLDKIQKEKELDEGDEKKIASLSLELADRFLEKKYV